jgi:hypothetical protein
VSGRSAFREETFAGRCGNEKNAPTTWSAVCYLAAASKLPRLIGSGYRMTLSGRSLVVSTAPRRRSAGLKVHADATAGSRATGCKLH